MDQDGWMVVALAAAAVLYLVGARWLQRRRAAREADRLLEEVLREKDGFRR
jgi:hypothetical protein